MWDYLIECIEKHSDSTVFDENHTMSYKTFGELSVMHGKKLLSKLKRKSKCAILCSESLNCAIALVACWHADMVPILISPNYGEEQNKKILELTTPSLLIIDDGSTSTAFNCYYDISRGSFSGYIDFKELDSSLSDVACIMCTSGTTGIPKGVLISTSALIENIRMINEYFRLTNSEKIIISRPLYHCAVLTGEFLVSLMNGTNIGFLDGKYNPIRVLDFIMKKNINVICGTPSLLYHISSVILKRNVITPIKKVVSSGECLSEKCARVIRKGFPTSKIFNVYGLTEAAPRVSYLPCEKFDEYPSSVGRPLKGIKIKVVDEQGQEVPINHRGEVLIKTPCIMEGYYNNYQLTNQVIQNGWLKTGDIGYKDLNGYLYIVSRADDMIIKGGMNIYPVEIENIIMQIDAIKDCIVYSHKNFVSEEIVIDIVFAEGFTEICEKELMAILSQLLPSYQMPSKINIVEYIQKTPSGKKIRPMKG